MTTAAEQIAKDQKAQAEQERLDREAREKAEQAEQEAAPAEADAARARREEQEQQRVDAAEKAAKVPSNFALPTSLSERETAAQRDREAATKAAEEYGRQSQQQHEQHQAELQAQAAEAGTVDPIEALCQAFESLPMSIGPNVRALVQAARAASGPAVTPIPTPAPKADAPHGKGA
jgi:hypothetical protein